MAETEKPTMSKYNLKFFIMKKLEDFSFEKIEISSIYGGNAPANTFDQDTASASSNGGGPVNDGPDEDWDN